MFELVFIHIKLHHGYLVSEWCLLIPKHPAHPGVDCNRYVDEEVQAAAQGCYNLLKVSQILLK